MKDLINTTRKVLIGANISETVELDEATELFKKGKITLTKFAMGKGKGLGLQINYGLQFIQVPEKDIKEITTVFNSVGFSSPPSWLKPYSVLSQGEKMRVDLAQAILCEKNLIVFDEFTSVVDRDVAQISSSAIQKSIRRSDKRFIAISCHYDVLDWLQPDWVFCTDNFQFTKKKDQNQKLNYQSMNATKDIGNFLGSIII